MSTKIRSIGLIDGRAYSGKSLLGVLETYAKMCLIVVPNDIPKWMKIREIFKKLPTTVTKQIWIMKERKGLGRQKSTYIRLCRFFGVGGDLRKKKRPNWMLSSEQGPPPSRPPRLTIRHGLLEPEDRAAYLPAIPRPTQAPVAPSPMDTSPLLDWNFRYNTVSSPTGSTLFSYGTGGTQVGHNRQNDPGSTPAQADSPEEP